MKRSLTLSILFFVFLIFSFFTSKVYAQEIAARSSAVLISKGNIKAPDSRTEILKSYLKQYDSPLVSYAQSFVDTADKYNLDWRLVVAISGVESTFGQRIPYDSYNGWGWGIYGDHMIRFSSWNEGIETVSEGLRNKYINKWGAQDIYAIGRFYAASPTWAQRVVYFMNSIEQFQNTKSATKLALAL